MPAAPLSPSVSLVQDQAVSVCPTVQKGESTEEVLPIREDGIASACASFRWTSQLGYHKIAYLFSVKALAEADASPFIRTP